MKLSDIFEASKFYFMNEYMNYIILQKTQKLFLIGWTFIIKVIDNEVG